MSERVLGIEHPNTIQEYVSTQDTGGEAAPWVCAYSESLN